MTDPLPEGGVGIDEAVQVPGDSCRVRQPPEVGEVHRGRTGVEHPVDGLVQCHWFELRGAGGGDAELAVPEVELPVRDAERVAREHVAGRAVEDAGKLVEELAAMAETQKKTVADTAAASEGSGLVRTSTLRTPALNLAVTVSASPSAVKPVVRTLVI